MHWKTKATLFRLFDKIPFGEELHYLSQRHVTRTWPRPEEDVMALIGAALRHVEDFRRVSDKPLVQTTFFEIGAGRDLVVPVVLRLMGAKKVFTSDINRLAKLDLLNAAAQVIARRFDKPIPTFKSWGALEAYGVSYMAPFDAAKDKVPQIDAFISNEVLEHIPPGVLPAIFRNVSSSLSEGGVSIHAIDYSDHYARDGGVSRYNFLQFSDEDWRPFNAGLHYVNRLRHSQYIKVMKDAGLQVAEAETHEGDYPPDLQVSEAFSGFDKKDLHIMRSRISAVKSESRGR